MIDLPRIVAESDVGSVAKVQVWRKNKIIEFEVKLGELPEQTYVSSKKSKKEFKDAEIKSLGLSIKETDNENGVVVTKINDQMSKLKINDIIKEINMEEIIDIDSFKITVNKFQKTGRSTLLLKVKRDDELVWITIKYLNN